MRVAKAGLFAWSPDGGVASNGWIFDMGLTLSAPDERQALAAILNHIADAHGLTLSIDPAQAEALTEEALEKMRREGEV